MKKNKNRYIQSFRKGAGDKTSSAPDHLEDFVSKNEKTGNRNFYFKEEETHNHVSQKEKALKRDLQRSKAKEKHLQEKLQETGEHLPKKKKLRVQREFDPETGKRKTKLKLQEEVKTPKKISSIPTTTFLAEKAMRTGSFLKTEEEENTGEEIAGVGTQSIAYLARKAVKTAYQKQQRMPSLKMKQLEKKLQDTPIKALYQQERLEHPERMSNPLSRFQQKRRIKKAYVKELREAKKQAQNSRKGVKKTRDLFGEITDFFKGFATKHKGILLAIGIFAFLFVMLSSSLSSCSMLLQSGSGMVVSGTYIAEDHEILEAENGYLALERKLQKELAEVESTHPGFDEYRYQVDQIGHNPHELISFLTLKHEDFKATDVQETLQNLLSQQYSLSFREETETRYRTETTTSTDPVTGETVTETKEVPYEYRILYVTLKNKGLGIVTAENLTESEKSRYALLLRTRGNKPHLFADNIYANPKEGENYKIPKEALSDPSFASLMKEAEKYLGYPYVWGGSSPSTSFDCSGFVCWVYTKSGVANIPRTTAQGIYNQCAPVSASEARPGDIIFFTGTYDSGSPVSHVGIYVGNGMMLHCGSPIQYTSIQSPYWREHFYAFGRP